MPKSKALVVLRAVGISLLKSAAVMVATMLAMSVAAELGVIVAFAGSFLLMVGSYRREWKLRWPMVLLPPIACLLSFLFQLLLFRDNGVALVLALPALAGGAVLGWFRGRSHHVFRKGDAIFAQRTVLYLAIWAACFLVTQVFGLFRLKGLVEFGLISVAFSTAMLAAVAIVLLVKRRAALAAAVVVLLLVSVADLHASDDCMSDDDSCESSATTGGGGSSDDNTNETAAGLVSSVLIFVLGSGVNMATSIATATAESTVSDVEDALDEEPEGPEYVPPSEEVEIPPGCEGLTVNDGGWPDVPTGWVWYGEWTDPETAARWRREDDARRQKESDAFWTATQARSEARAEAHDRHLQDEGFVYDEEDDVWRPGPDHEETRQKEILEKIRRQIDINAKIQDKMPMSQWGAVDDLGDKLIHGSNEETLDRLQRLGGAIYSQNYAATEREAAEAQLEAIEAARAEARAKVVQVLGIGATLGLGIGAAFVPSAAAVASEMSAIAYGGHVLGSAGAGYVQGGPAGAICEATRAALPVNTVISLVKGEDAFTTGVSVLRDLGAIIGLRDSSKCISALSKSAGGLMPKVRISGEGVSVTMPKIGDAGDELASAMPKVSGAGDEAAENLPKIRGESHGTTPSPGEIDAAWQAARQEGQELVDEFADLHRRLQNATGAEAKLIREQMRQKAIEINASYPAKSILKPHRNEITKALDDEISSIYGGVDENTAGRLNELGVNRGGRAFSKDDLVDLRNASSAGTVGMDRDVALNEMLQRRLIEKMNAARPGSDEANLYAKALAELRKEHPDLSTYERFLKGRMGRAQPGSEEAELLQRDWNDLLKAKDLGGTKLTADPDAYIDFLRKQQATVRAGSVEEQELLRELKEWQKWRSANPTGERPISATTWNKMTQRVYNEQYRAATGTDPDQAYQAVTQGHNPEAYRDLNVLANDPARVPFSQQDAAQTASVTSYKTYHNAHLAERGLITHGDAIQETARGLAKDMKTKLIPLLQSDAGTDAARLTQLKRMMETLDEVGKGNISPGQANAELQRILPNVPDMTLEKAVRMVDANMETAIKYRVPLPSEGGAP